MKIVDLNGAVIGEIPVARIVTGLPDLIVRDGFSEVWDRPGMGVEAEEALPLWTAIAQSPTDDRDVARKAALLCRIGMRVGALS